jgi:hypothetical protein
VGLVQFLKSRVIGRQPMSSKQMAKTRPVQNGAVSVSKANSGAIQLVAPLQQQGRGFASAVAKWMQAPDTKTFELDEVGAFVWELCDGKHTFEGISKELCRRYKMNRVEADASLAAYLQTLGQRRLITFFTVAIKNEARPVQK